MDIPLVNSDIHAAFHDPPFQSKENTPTKSYRDFARNNAFPSSQLSYPLNNHLPSSSSQPLKESKNSFKVFVRIRPLNNKEQSSNVPKRKQIITKAEDNMIFLFPPNTGKEPQYKQERSYIFDNVFDHKTATIEVYEKALEPAVKNVLNGYNSTILAYGMTGAGKTFTMFGDIYNSMGGIDLHPGIVSLVVKDLFAAFEKEAENGFKFNIKLSYLEIYNEHARDLLTPECDEMMIVEDSQKGIIIPNLSEFPIKEHDEIVKYILQGNQRRVMASTHANQFSSRSHAIIQLTIEKRSKTMDIVQSFLQSKLSLVDLAGSERAAVSENRGMRQREGANINRSLLALGNCINVLSDSRKKGAFVPYRDSKLTRLLKDSLGGNTRTVMLACISPSYLAYEETSNTLKYASGARNIKRRIIKNVKEVELHISEYKEIIDSLKTEVHALKLKLFEKDDQNSRKTSKIPQNFQTEIDKLIDEMSKKLLSIFEESWEISQSINDLEGLKEQNEENLKNKLEELEKAVGDINLYNQITEEVSALKEVMRNNENILVEKAVNLEKSNQEKKKVQAEIVELISQCSQSAQNTPNDENTKHIEKSLKLLEMENDILDQNFIFRQESEISKVNAPNESKILSLELELRKMKKQLEEKDKQLAQNEQLIKTLSQFKEKPKAIKASLLLSPRQASKNSPIKTRIITNDLLQDYSKMNQESYKLEQNIEVLVPNKKNPKKEKITSPITIKVNQPWYNIKSPEKPQSSSNVNSVNTSTIIAKSSDIKQAATRNGRGDSQIQRDESVKKQTILVLEKAQLPKGNSIKKKSDPKKNKDKHRQSCETISIEDLKSYSEKLNKINFENVEKKTSDDKSSYLQHYQNRKKKQEDATLLRQQSTIYKISDQPYYPSIKSTQHQSQSNLNNLKTPIKIEHESIVPTESQTILTTPKAQTVQQLQVSRNAESSSPELSSIGQSYEQSGDLSMKEILLENFSIDHKDKKKEHEKSPQDDKENVQDLEDKDIEQNKVESSLAQKGIYTRSYSSASTNPKNASQKRNEGLQMIECRNLETSDLKNMSSASKSTDKILTPGQKDILLNNTHQAKVKAVVSNFYTYSKQYYSEDSENKYSKRYEIIKGKKTVHSVINEKSQQLLGNGNSLIYEVNSLNSSKHPKKSDNPNEVNLTRNNYTITDSTNTSLAKDTGRHGIRSLETMRELVKGFRARLHGLSALVTGNQLDEIHYEEMADFLSDYKANGQSFPLSNADLNVIQNLERILEEKIHHTDNIQTNQMANSNSLQKLHHQADVELINIINSNEFSREVCSENNTQREQQEENYSSIQNVQTPVVEKDIIDEEQLFYQGPLMNNINNQASHPEEVTDNLENTIHTDIQEKAEIIGGNLFSKILPINDAIPVEKIDIPYKEELSSSRESLDNIHFEGSN